MLKKAEKKITSTQAIVVAIISGSCVIIAAFIGTSKSTEKPLQVNPQVNNYIQLPTSPPQVDSTTKIKKSQKPLINTTSTQPLSKTDTTTKTKFDLRGAKFNGPTVLENNGTININSQAPRTFEGKNLSDFLEAFPDKTIRVAFLYFGDVDQEMVSLRKNVITTLQANGYTNVSTSEPVSTYGGTLPKTGWYQEPNGSLYFKISRK